MENNVRPIDANALKKSLQESYDELMRKRNNTPYGEERMIADAQLITFSECILRLKGQPTIDPVQVVRCKECKYKDTWYKDEVYNVYVCGLSGLHIVEDRDFCSYGERR